jgi:hypothetical protein
VSTQRARTIVASNPQRIGADRSIVVALMVETKSPANPLFLRDEELRQGIELMFYA